jgi:hypothetical protein
MFFVTYMPLIFDAARTHPVWQKKTTRFSLYEIPSLSKKKINLEEVTSSTTNLDKELSRFIILENVVDKGGSTIGLWGSLTPITDVATIRPCSTLHVGAWSHSSQGEYSRHVDRDRTLA